MNKPLKGFITYSHKDTEQKDKLRECLAVMEQQNEFLTWDDCQLTLILYSLLLSSVGGDSDPRSSLLLSSVGGDSNPRFLYLHPIFLKPIDGKVYNSALRHELAIRDAHFSILNHFSCFRTQKILTEAIEI